MNKLQLHPLAGGGAPPHFIVKPHRVGRPPAPWAWAIYEEGSQDPTQWSSRFYRSAADAWQVGTAVLQRLGKPVQTAAMDRPEVPPPQQP